MDCSIVISTCYQDEQSELAWSILRSFPTHEVFVPAIWPLEVMNVLLAGERRGRSSRADTVTWTSLFWSLPLIIDTALPETCSSEIAQLARTNSISAYDASYLELSIRERAALATLDHAMQEAARRIGVRLAVGGI